MESWLFLNATADPSELEADEKSAIIFKLSSFDGSEISDYDASKMNIALDLSQTLGQLDKTSAPIGENITYTAKESGNATVTGKFETASYTVSLTNSDPRTPTSINVTNSTLDLKVKDDVAAGATLTPADAGNLTYTSSNSSVAVVENGRIKALAAGSAIITVSFAGNEKYFAAENKTIQVAVKKPVEIISSGVTTLYNTDDHLIVDFKDDKGSPLVGAKVTVDLNGAKTYTTDSNGQVKISTKGLPAKTYTVKITFEGNDTYSSSTQNVKVVVTKLTPKITAKAKTFKTSTKTKKYTITLKDNNDKAIKNAKVTLKVKGKTYKATTNSKGQATFKITKLNTKGTFKATVTYNGDNYFNKVVKKVDIKVKSVWKTVSKGSKDKSTVKAIQRALKNHGYYLTYDGHYLKIDGKFNSCTFRFVKEFQHDKGLKVTGKVDEKTAKKLGLI